MPKPPVNLNEFSSLVQLMKDLRGPDGCPWDKEQTHETLAPYAIEETFEMVEALNSNNDQDFCEELGDVLFQVVLHAQLADERKAFHINDVISAISEKLVRRHPHVFTDLGQISKEAVLENWDIIKAKEKKGKPKPLFKFPKGLPATQAAQKIGDKTEKLNFDWAKPLDVLAHLKSEITELENEIKNQQVSATAVEHEIGDVLFTTVQLARHLNVDAESALRKTNLRFTGRFNAMLDECGKDLNQWLSLSTEKKEKLWQEIKVQETE